MGILRTLDRSASFAEMTDFLASCEGSVPARRFNALSNKRRIDLYREFRFEIDIHQEDGERVLFNPLTGERFVVPKVAVRSARNIKGFVRNPTEEVLLIETGRTYRNGVTVLTEDVSVDRWSFSETLERDEDPKSGFIRGLSQELGVREKNIDPEKIDYFHTTYSFHPSSAYAGVWTQAYSIWFEFETHQLSSSFKFRPKRDNGVMLHWKWIPDEKIYRPRRSGLIFV